MDFEWDENKNTSNKAKHGISFETAALVFNDKNRVELYDELHSTADEERIITIGKVHDVFFVVYTERNDKIRLISARIAEKAEKEAYYGTR